jgi:AraC family transcriptional regulator, transcriptional activator of the genes for pyochelin and ferripyochelin receptors
MNPTATIGFDEFNFHTTQKREVNGFNLTERNHPEFGYWRESRFSLDHMTVYQHQTNLVRPVIVKFEKEPTANYVHHCISLDGEIGAHFRDTNISASLMPHRFHQLYVPENEYALSMGQMFTNVHIEIDRAYYINMLCESEAWSAKLRNSLAEQEVFYPGEQVLSQQMIITLQDIFNSPLSGSLKRLLIEAKVQELVALQLNTVFGSTERKKQHPANRELFHSIRDYLSINFLQEHSLKEIARNFAINEFLLKKGFRENFNTTVFDFLLNKRLEYAREQLVHHNFTVQEISTLVGYKYANHFSTAFKKRFGISPASVKR